MTAPLQNARWLAIYLPRLKTDRLIRAGRSDDRPLAIYSKAGGAYQLTGVDARGSALGLRLAMSLADARAMQPSLHAVEAEPDEDARTLDAIAGWCERFTPVVAIDPPEGLFLDISGCAHLFGGEEQLRCEVTTRLRAQGFAARAAIAPTPGAAWALARYARNQGGEELAPLPAEALRLDPEAAALLRRLGLKTIGQLLGAPRSAFTARAGERAMLRLDQALGRAPEALSPRRPAPPVYAQRRFLEPILAADAVLQVTEDLCADAVRQLDLRGAGALRVELVLFGVDGRDRVLGVDVSRPLREVKPLLRLFREKLNIVGENFDAEFGFEAARLDVVRVARIDVAAQTLAGEEETAASVEKISAIVDVLSSRLGPKRIVRPQLREEHAAEHAAGWRSALSKASKVIALKPSLDGVQRRPIRLFASAQPIEVMASVPDGPPIRFRWRRVMRDVVRAEGPERISGAWRRREMTRDYYRVEDKQGRRYWLYREGLYGESDAIPRWFVHGLFA